MKKNVLISVITLLVVFSCKKEDTDDKNNFGIQSYPMDSNKVEQVIEVSTPYGNMYLWLYKHKPQHRNNFLKLADEKFYDGTTFHRIIPNFMIQGGDPNSKDSNPLNDGRGGPGYTIPAELDTLKNRRGFVAAARLDDRVNPSRASSGSQFYINVVNNTHLDGLYTVFGYVMKGMEVADSIVMQPRDTADRPLSDIQIQVKVIEKTEAQIKSEYGYVVN